MVERAERKGGPLGPERLSENPTQCTMICVLLVCLLLSSLNLHKCSDVRHRLRGHAFILRERKQFSCCIKTSVDRANAVGPRAEREASQRWPRATGGAGGNRGSVQISLENSEEALLDLKS